MQEPSQQGHDLNAGSMVIQAKFVICHINQLGIQIINKLLHQ